jgi:hypothetical protein
VTLFGYLLTRVTTTYAEEDSGPTDLDFEKALMYFHAYMYGPLQGKLRLYTARNIRSAGGTTMASDWEVFTSILVDDLGQKLASGVDLSNHEVKSAAMGGGYEYQYHKNTGQQKLARDMKVGHLFFEYADNLRLVNLRFVHGSKMKKKFFTPWLESYPDPYPQRYRKSVSNSWVKSNGILLMTLTSGEVTFPEPVKERVQAGKRKHAEKRKSKSATSRAHRRAK